MKHIKLISTAALLLLSVATQAQNMGLSFSYFIPRHGDFSTPMSPFSIRGVGIDLNNYLAVQTGASLYRMAGLGMTGLPFQSEHSMVGPNFTAFVPAEFVIQLKGRKAQFDIKGGGFAFYGFGQRLNYGNWDRAIRDWKGWNVANADLTYTNHPGVGWQAGVEFTIEVTRQFGVSLEVNYLAGRSALPVKGTYSGGMIGGQTQTLQADFSGGAIDFTGLEFSIGVMSLGGGGRR